MIKSLFFAYSGQNARFLIQTMQWKNYTEGKKRIYSHIYIAILLSRNQINGKGLEYYFLHTTKLKLIPVFFLKMKKNILLL